MLQFKNYITCIDAHTAGEPLRIVTSGFPPIPGQTILEKRKYVKENYDHIRSMMMLEPRGHSGMYGCIITEPVTPDGDFGVLFTHNEGLSTMCGHGIIAVTKVVLQTGIIPPREGKNTIRIDSPAGRITAFADVKDGYVGAVSFNNVPSFLYMENIEVDVDDIGTVVCDIAFGGAFYVYVDVSKINTTVDPANIEYLVQKGMEIKNKVIAKYNVVHPEEPGLNSIYGTIFMDKLEHDENKVTSKNVCIFAEGQIDRSPTGTGTGGRIALMLAKGQIDKETTLVNVSVIDTPFTCKVVEEVKVAELDAVIPEVRGNAYITGFNQLVLDPEDPLATGFRITGG
ncbi:MAG TPA: proline racemase family protein [Clostridiaceae bacterium]|nr:proline racemase family protein [Clostridiaceae bacterium]